MGIENYKCCICGGPDDPEESQVVVIPRYVAHKKCFDRSGLEIEELASRMPCCQSKTSLKALGGHLLTRRTGIPPTEVWIADPASKKLLRYRIEADGYLSQIASPTEDI